MVDLNRVTVVIPALNEEASLPLVLSDLPSVGQVIVVDNGSHDRTAEVARQHGATATWEPQRGYGAACLRGLTVVAEQVNQGRPPPMAIAFLDADYSDHPDMLPELAQPVLARKYDFVLGSRLLGIREKGAMPPQSVYGNQFACFLMRILFRGNYTDLGPFRVISYACLRRLNMVDRNFGWTVEMQIKALRAGLRIREIPVPYRCRTGTSKISGTVSGTLRAGTKILWLIARHGLSLPGSPRVEHLPSAREWFSLAITPRFTRIICSGWHCVLEVSNVLTQWISTPRSWSPPKEDGREN